MSSKSSTLTKVDFNVTMRWSVTTGGITCTASSGEEITLDTPKLWNGEGYNYVIKGVSTNALLKTPSSILDTLKTLVRVAFKHFHVTRISKTSILASLNIKTGTTQG